VGIGQRLEALVAELQLHLGAPSFVNLVAQLLVGGHQVP